MHCKLVIISVSLLCIGSAQNLRTPKIFGGSPGYIPYAVSIFHKEGFYVCGGVTLSKTVIATTANCATLFRHGELMVRSGSWHTDQGGSFTPVRRTARHRNFTSDSPDYDIGILMLDGTADEKSRAVELAEREVNDGETLLVSGWGSTEVRTEWNGAEENGPLSNKMNSVRVSKIGRDKCKLFYNGQYEITPRMICGSSPGTGLCKGDVGGPVVWRDRLVGIISFGKGCGKPGHPGVFTNVASPEIRKFLRDSLEIPVRGSTEQVIGSEPGAVSDRILR